MDAKIYKVPRSAGKGGIHLTEEQMKIILPGIVRLYREGFTLREIGARINRGHVSIRNYLLAEGVRLRHRGPKRQPAPLPEILSDDWYIAQMLDPGQQIAALNILRKGKSNAS